MSYYGSTPPPPPPPPPFGGYQPAGYGSAPAAAPLASWIERVGAYLIDGLVTLPFAIPMFIFMPKTVSTNVNGEFSTTKVGGSIGLFFLMILLSFAVQGYNRWYLGGQGQSLGKRVLGLTLVNESTGEPIGMGMAFLRDLAQGIDSLICDIGWLFPLWDEKRQTIADKVVGTVVTGKG